MKEPNCPTCGKRRPKGWTESVRKRQSENIKKALSNSDMKLGRPRYEIDEAVLEMRKQGLSIREIAWRLQVSVQPVKRVLYSSRNDTAESESVK